MRTNPFHFAPAALLLTTVFAQAPSAQEPRPAAPAGIQLQSLQMLTTESVYTRQPAADKQPTTEKDKAGKPGGGVFAAIRDAEFDFDGTLVALVIDAPAGQAGDKPNPAGGEQPKASPAGGEVSKRRLLPAKSLQYDAQQKRWTADPNVKFADLAEYTPAASKRTPASTLMQPRMASELISARPAPATPAGAEATVDASARKSAGRIVWWLSPSNQQLAFATVPHEGKNLAVPWSVLRTRTGPEALGVSIEAPPNVIADAPVSTSPDEPPSAALRHQSYKHFNVAPPKWDRAPEPTDKEKGKDDKGKESGGK